MLSEFLFYLLGIVAVLKTILLPRANRCGASLYGWHQVRPVDSAFDFDRLRRKQYGAGVPGALRRRRTRSTLPVLNEVTREPRQLRDAGEQLIPVASIVVG